MSRNYWIRFILLFLFWQFLAGSWDLNNISAGLVIAFIVTRISLYFFPTTEIEQILKIKYVFIYLNYLFKLIKEVVLANIELAGIVLSPNMSISPGVISYKTRLKKDITRVILANTITLTPGTLTVEIDSDELSIHAINKDQGLNLEALEGLLLRLEGEQNAINI